MFLNDVFTKKGGILIQKKAFLIENTSSIFQHKISLNTKSLTYYLT